MEPCKRATRDTQCTILYHCACRPSRIEAIARSLHETKEPTYSSRTVRGELTPSHTRSLSSSSSCRRRMVPPSLMLAS